ncbi:MAG: cbb3-type cytochrome c oxidase subunit 3 [Pseudomonadota bacterium]|nr:cbb3-type cytochrome c oxidase subunit 3 [Pseudomonadota bacterium]
MDTYSIFREIADSWVLLAMFAFFVLTVLWVFRPGSGDLHKDAAQAPFRNDEPGADMKEARQ